MFFYLSSSGGKLALVGEVETVRARAPSAALTDRDFQRRAAAARLRVDVGGVRAVWRSQTRRMRKSGLPTQPSS